MTLTTAPLAHLDLPTLQPERKLWSTWLSRILSAALLIAIVFQLGQIDAKQLQNALPQNLWFLPVLLALYFALPIADWIIFRRLWALPASGFLILLAKRIGNEVLISYSGEVYFYLWARKRTELSAAPFGAIKDVNILSALAANLVALLLLLLTYPLISQLNLGQYSDESVTFAAIMLMSSFLILLFSRRVFTLERPQLWWIFGVHIVRLSAGVLLCALLWFIILPGPHFGFWLVLSMIRLLVGRLPFFPNKEALFAVIAIFLVGQDSAVSTLITLTASTMLAMHVLVAATLGALALVSPDTSVFPKKGQIVMKYILAIGALGWSMTAYAVIPPKAERGRNGADCRASESGPAVNVSVIGLKDRKGKLILELYPENDTDFLQSDKVLIAAGKPFRRVPMTIPSAGPVSICIRAPGPGRYALALLHDRDDNGKFGLSGDGVGFANNPKLGFSKPKVKAVALAVGPGVRSISIVMKYRQGIGIGPIKNQTAESQP